MKTALSDKSEQKKLEREYKDVAEALKAMTEVMNEPRIEFPSRKDTWSIYSSQEVTTDPSDRSSVGLYHISPSASCPSRRLSAHRWETGL